MRGFLFILILCLALAFGALLDSEAEQIPASNSPLSLTPKHETMIVAAPDGIILLVNLSSGNTIWSFESGPSIYSLFQALPDNHGDDHNVSTERNNFYIDCGEDWKLYMHGDNNEKVEELPLSVDELLRRTPSVFPGGVMLGLKNTTVFLVDYKSGRVIHQILERNDLVDLSPSSTMDLDLADNPLYIMRSDYAIEYVSTKTGEVYGICSFLILKLHCKVKELRNFLVQHLKGQLSIEFEIAVH